MASKCTISFDNNPLGVYYAGQVVSGTAELITTRPKTIRSIYISVSGFAEVRWFENITKQDTHGKPQKAIETFSGTELYYSTEKYVFGQSGGAPLELPAGKYVFPFQGIVSPIAPTSLNGTWGQIQHEVSLVIDRIMRYNNTFKKTFTVISPYDLNLNAQNAKPLHKIDEKIFCWSFCCGTRGPMVMTVKVPFSSYAPGQKLRFHIILDNQSNVHCSDVKVRLMKKVTFTSRSPEAKTQVVEIKLADNHCGEVVKFNKAEFNEFLQIPSTTPTSLESCSIIKVSYTLKFIAKVRMHSDFVIEFPLTIGTVPLEASANDQGPVTAQPEVAPTYKPFSPPMFEEDVRSEQFGSNTFKPRYPVFLADAHLTNEDSSKNPPPAGKYPAPTKAPAPVPKPTATPAPSPLPEHTPEPSAPMAEHTADASAPATPPAYEPPAPPSYQQPSRLAVNTINIHINTPHQVPQTLEALGFSIPPGYEPTPSAPAAIGASDNIGWK